MRRIRITPEIEALAKRYARGMMVGKDLEGKPVDNLKALQGDLGLSSTTSFSRQSGYRQRRAERKKCFKATNCLNMPNTWGKS